MYLALPEDVRLSQKLVGLVAALQASCVASGEPAQARTDERPETFQPSAIEPPPAEVVSEPSRAPRILPASPPEPPLSFPARWKRAAEMPGSLAAADRAMWRRYAPEVETVRIRSSLDGAIQRAQFYAPRSSEPRPLLVVLHSWSASYLQNIHIPYAEFAIANDWAFIHPDFRGHNRRPEATVSELAVQDVIDAVEHARANANIDDSRIYLMGYSGGAMMAMVLAGLHPERWAAVATWVAVYDLPAWYERMARRGSRYAREIEKSCGGSPKAGSKAYDECFHRSPAAHLHRAAGRTPVFIAHGLGDLLASPGHAIDAFNALAAPADRITPAQRASIVKERAIPSELSGTSSIDRAAFDEAGLPIALERTSQGATLVLFEGDHDMLYAPGLRWLAAHRRPEADFRLAAG